MKVYVAVQGWDYEGFTIIGVFDSKEKAQIAIDLSIQTDNYVDYYDVYEYNLNSSEVV